MNRLGSVKQSTHFKCFIKSCTVDINLKFADFLPQSIFSYFIWDLNKSPVTHLWVPNQCLGITAINAINMMTFYMLLTKLV